ncbi:MAG: YdcF family protein [Alphaproteobacteria bacterium]|nr:YdcF family protein [Alphaproteobacteria bacterium]
MRWVVRGILAVLLVALAAGAWDFTRFVARADKVVTAGAPKSAQAVTTLTGASDARIVAGVKLAEALHVPLLISGVHVDTTPADIARIAGVTESEILCCVTLGRAAATTEGNGLEVADWARRHKLKDIVVVTSEYHMDRAMLELRHAMPEATFVPYAVSSTKVAPRKWYSDGATARRLFEEWAKYRVASLRLGGKPKPAPNGRSG